MSILPLIPGERAWSAADRAAKAPPLQTRTTPPLDGNRAAHYAAIANPGDDWAEIDEAAWYDALECLPPHYVQGGFCVSEPVTDGPHGALYLTCARSGGRYFAAYRVPSQYCAHGLFMALGKQVPS